MQQFFLNFFAKRAGMAGMAVVEVLLAAGLFVIFATAAITVVLQSLDMNRLGEEQAVATQFASEGIEAMKSIKNQAYANIVNTAGTGITRSGGVWTFFGASNIFGKYTRVLSVTDVQRDVSGNIVASGGTVDATSKKVTSTVSWNVSAARLNSVVLNSYLTNWRAAIGKGGMLVYGDGSTTTDAMRYKTFDGSTWSSAALTADVDGGSANRAARALRLYNSASRTEKILISRHYNGTTQTIYAQVWNGTSWGNLQQLSTWNAATFLDVQNFDGTYLSNGNFMAVFSDNTAIPKMRIWNGSVWSAQTSLTSLGGAGNPTFIVAKARPGTNEVMTAFYTQASDTVTQYYNGTTWSAITSHATNAPLTTKRFVDFDWSPNNALIGGLVFSNSTTDRSLHIRIWTANGLGSGAWSAIANSSNQGVGSTRLGALAIIGRPGANEFVACSTNTITQVICYQSNFTPTWTNPTNQTLTSTTDAGIQRPFHIGYEQSSGNPAISVYSDSTDIPKLKKYAPTTWDAAATNLAPLGAAVKTVRIIPQTGANDLMIVVTDNNNDVYTAMWDGTNNLVATTPVGNATLETNVDSNVLGQAEAFFTTATANGSITAIAVYLNSTSTTTNAHAGLYTDAAGSPGTLLGSGNSTTLVSGAWNVIPISTTAVSSGTNYWIAILGTTSGTMVFRDRAGGPCTSRTSLSTTLTSLPASWTNGASFTTCPISAYGITSGQMLMPQGFNGSATTDYWYDFAWDN